MELSFEYINKILKFDSIIKLDITIYNKSHEKVPLKNLKKQTPIPYSPTLNFDKEKRLDIQYGNYNEIWLVFPLKNYFIAVGPALYSQETQKYHKLYEKQYLKQIPTFSSDDFRNLLITIDSYFFLNLEKYYVSLLQQIIINQKKQIQNLSKNEFDSYLTSFYSEHRLLNFIATGDSSALHKLEHETPLGILPIPETHSIRDEKNECILLMEKISWFTIQIGLDIKKSLSLRNFYTKEIEKQERLVDVLIIRDSAIMQFKESIHKMNEKSYSSFINQIIQYIGLHIYDTNIVSNIEKYFYISNSHLRHLFKKEVGISIGNYIQKQKIIVAKYLLLSQIPPHEVANKLNYHDSSHFSKVFKKHTGQTPLQFQKFESHRIIDPEK